MVGWPTVTNIVGGHHIVCSVFRCSVCPRIRKYALEGFVPQGRLTELAGTVTCEFRNRAVLSLAYSYPPMMKWICA